MQNIKNKNTFKTSRPQSSLFFGTIYINNCRKYVINNNNKKDTTQTWSEYIYPFFTSDYYYAGEIVVAAALIGTGIACYYYAPAISNYFYKNINTTTSTLNINSNTVINNETTIYSIDTLINIKQETTIIAIDKMLEPSKKILIDWMSAKIVQPHMKKINDGIYNNEIQTFFKRKVEDIVFPAMNCKAKPVIFELETQEEQTITLIKQITTIVRYGIPGIDMAIIDQIMVGIEAMQTANVITPELELVLLALKTYKDLTLH